MGQSKSVEITPFNRWLTSSHYHSILCFYLAPFLKYSEILVEICDLNLPHLYLAFPLRVTPFEFRRDLKSEMFEITEIWSPLAIVGVVCVILCLAVWVQCPLVTDRQTDRTTDIRTTRRTQDDSIYRASIASCGKKNLKLNACYGRRRRAQC